MADIKGIELASDIYGLEDTQARTKADGADSKASTNATAISEIQGDVESLASETTSENTFEATLNASFIESGGVCRGASKNGTTFLTFDFTIKSDVSLQAETVLFNGCPAPSATFPYSIFTAFNQTDADIATFTITSNGNLIPGYASKGLQAGKRYLGYLSYLS